MEDHRRRHHLLLSRVTLRKIDDGVQAAVAATAAANYGTGIETGIATGDGTGTTLVTGEAGGHTENEAGLEEMMDLVKEEVVEAEVACAWEGKANGPDEGNEWEEKRASFCCILHSFRALFFLSYLLWGSISLHLLDGVCCITTKPTSDLRDFSFLFFCFLLFFLGPDYRNLSHRLYY